MAYDAEREAVEEELVSYLPYIKSVIHAYTRHEHLTEDLVQDTYLRALQFVRTRGPPERPRAWLRRIATNVTMAHYHHHPVRRDGLGREEIQQYPDPVMSEPGEPLMAQESREVRENGIAWALGRLRDRQRNLLVSHYYHGKPYEQLALEHGLSRQNVKVRMHRARRRLQEVLSQDRLRGLEG